MTKKYTVIAVIRTFNNPDIAQSIRNVLGIGVDHVVLAVNADAGNKGEDENFTKKIVTSNFNPDEFVNKRLIVHAVHNWGRNPGSAAALNDALSEFYYRERRLPSSRDLVLNLSVESRLEAIHCEKARELFANHDNLAVVGVKRKIIVGKNLQTQFFGQKHEDKLQYRLPQNTASFWRADLLRLAGGFRTECDFSGLKVEIGDETIPVAGMDDYPTLLNLVLLGFKWSLVEDNPFIWDLTNVKLDEERWQQNLRKIKRQESVMGIWSRKFFQLTFEEALFELEKARLDAN